MRLERLRPLIGIRSSAQSWCVAGKLGVMRRYLAECHIGSGGAQKNRRIVYAPEKK